MNGWVNSERRKLRGERERERNQGKQVYISVFLPLSGNGKVGEDPNLVQKVNK